MGTLYNSDFRDIDLDQIDRQIEKTLELLAYFRDDLEKNKHNAHPFYLLKQAELIQSAADTLEIYMRMLADHMRLHPEKHIHRANKKYMAMKEESNERSSFRRN